MWITCNSSPVIVSSFLGQSLNSTKPLWWAVIWVEVWITWPGFFGVENFSLFCKKVVCYVRFEPSLILCSNDSFSIFASVFVLSWFNISISITAYTTLSTLYRDPQPALKRHLVVKSWWLHSHSLTDLITEATAIETLISIVYIDNRTI